MFIKRIISIFLTIAIILAVTGIVSANPYGANYTEVNTTTAPEDPAESHDAYAGNMTELDVRGYSTTQSWQGYFGNVSGAIQLADGSDNIMYNWSLASPEGEIYASEGDSVSWATIECFNMASNLTTSESAFNIDSDAADGIDETFYLNDHTEFYIGSTQFTSGQCNNTKLYNDTGIGTFDEVLLYDVPNENIVFASILMEDATGFDSATHDFEMLVLEDGHSGDTSPTTYYFYVELE
jgi:hypothetical protein